MNAVDAEALRAANERFYSALEALDIDAMDALWEHDGWVRCVHPGSDVLEGWHDVRASWQSIFTHTHWLRVTATSVSIAVYDDIGLVGCSENITTDDQGDVGVAVAQATNVFRRTAQGWRLIHHHASPAPVHVTQPFNGTAQ